MAGGATLLGKTLACAALVEAGTGLVLILAPALVATLLLGTELSGVGVPVGRCFGVALLALGLACWPGRAGAERGAPPWRAMLTYNALLALYLVYLGTGGGLGGVLLWPAAALHAGVALVLVWTARGGRPNPAIGR